jgi:hypothetical protein
MNGIILLIHSLLRWILCILLLATIIKAIHGVVTKRAFSNSDNKISLFLMISAHTQLVVGLVLYFISPMVQFGNMKDSQIRFFTVEHSTLMLIAIVFITLARIRSKKAATDAAKFRMLLIFSLIALVIILLAVPWPYSPISRPWFSPN